MVTALVLVMLSSCRHGGTGASSHDSRYMQLDSMIGKIQDLDSLESLVRQSHEQNDAVSEMLALKYHGMKLHDEVLYVASIKSYTAALEIATNLADTVEMATALNGLGSSYRRMGELTTANASFFSALKLCDAYSGHELNEVLRLRASILNGIGNVETAFCNYTDADSVLHVALRSEQQLGNNFGIALNYGHLGNVKRYMGQIDSAWVYYRKSLEYNQMENSEGGVAMCHLHFGELQEDSRHFSRAVEEYKLAYDVLKEKGDIWHWLEACLALTRVHILLGEEQEAHRYLEEAEAAAEDIGSKQYQAEASMLHYELSLLEGDSQEALKHYIHGVELQDSIHGLTKGDEMHAQRINYERSVRSGEMDVLNRDITNLKQKRNRQILFTTLMLLMAAAVIGALVYANRVRARAQRKMRQVEETRSLFFTNVVHQLRSPLSAIMGAIDGIVATDKDGQDGQASGGDESTLRKSAEVIERQGQNLLMLVDRILQVGSVRSAIMEPDWRTGDVVTFVKMILESYRDSCVERHIELAYAPRESSVEIDLVPSYLNTIVGSLIENAINYSREYGKIIVTTRVDGDRFTIRVADDGIGISKEDLPHVFEPFYRSATAEHIVDGIGIGLTVVRDMAMAMGGTVAVDSKKDQGAVFTVELPCKHESDLKQRLEMRVEPLRKLLRRPQHSIPEPDPDSMNDTAVDSTLPVVLVVEDHSDVAHVVGQALGKEYTVYYATNGEQALAKVGDLSPDLIITDVKMPLMDGLELCRRLRKSKRFGHIPIIMLSARTSEKDRINGIAAGADAYLVKPFVREELCVWVNHLLESRQMMREAFAAGGQSEDDACSFAPEGSQEENDNRFLADFARELDKQCSSGEKIDYDRIAHKLRMGETQLRRKIQALTGKNVPAYVTQLRMEKAMRLLREKPDCLIGDIAEQCGFQDVAYFSRVFRQHYGMAPSQARNNGK